MIIGHFTERPYRYLEEERVFDNGAFFAVSNKYFDRQKASEDYNYYLDEAVYCEEVGFDAVAINEHHGNPFCMGSVITTEAAILARITNKAKIVLIGNPLPILKHPLRVAEELAEIDLISGGRLVSGWVRGAGSEQFFNNANPTYNREMFNEAHSFILRAWTEPGPWRYEGKHFHYRHVNPWAVPLQDPYPQQWIPGLLSPETLIWSADMKYPYVGLGTALGPTCDLWDIYADRAAEAGWQAGPECFGYLLPLVLAETEEKAHELGKGFVWGMGQGAFSRAEHTLPPGYTSKAAIRKLADAPGGSWLGVSKEKLAQGFADDSGDNAAPVDYDAIRGMLEHGYEEALQSMQIVVGTPKTVIPRIKELLATIRPGILTVFNVQGPISNEDRMTSVRLIGEHFIPEIKEWAKGQGLTGPFDVAPGSRKLTPGVARDPVVDRDGLRRLGLIA